MSWDVVITVAVRLAILAGLVLVVILATTKRRGQLPNPIGIHCVECTKRRPCSACRTQIEAEADAVRNYRRPQ